MDLEAEALALLAVPPPASTRKRRRKVTPAGPADEQALNTSEALAEDADVLVRGGYKQVTICTDRVARFACERKSVLW
jgi:hypothetical protein